MLTRGRAGSGSNTGNGGNVMRSVQQPWRLVPATGPACGRRGRMRPSLRVRIFLSYRRADVGGHAGRLHDTLTRLLGPKGVFHDVTAIAPGRDFTAEVDRAIRECDAVFAVIGPGWLTATNPDGSR